MRKRLKKGEKNGQKRMACVGGVYSVSPFRRTAEEVLDEILRKEKQQQRLEPKNKRLRAVLTREVDGKKVNAKDVVFDWLAEEVWQRDPQATAGHYPRGVILPAVNPRLTDGRFKGFSEKAWNDARMRWNAQ